MRILSEKEGREFIEAIEQEGNRLIKNRKAAREVLISIGILTPTGRIRKSYKNKCIRRDRG